MKKLLLAFCVVLALFTGCQNNASGTDENPSVNPTPETPSQTTLKQKIADAKNGSAIDLGSEELKIEENDSYTISKPLTIKNGNIKNATFVVESTKVTLENITDIKSIIVDEKVGDGDFVLKNCQTVGEIYVNGGGQNSVHIEKTTVEKLVVQKKDVRIALSGDNSTKIEKTLILEDCKLDSENKESSFGDVIVSDIVKKLELAGNTKIEKIVSTATDSENQNITIVVEADVTIVAADSTVKEAVKNNEKNSEFNKKSEEIKDTTIELSEQEKAEIEKVKEEKIKKEAEIVEKMNFIVANQDKISESFEGYSDSSVQEISEVSIEKQKTQIIVSNINASSEYSKIWNYILVSKIPVEAKQGKNYKISFDLKADKESKIILSACDFSTSNDSAYIEHTVGTEWKTYSVETGTALSDWSLGFAQIACGTVSKLYLKNYKVEEVEPKIAYAIYRSSESDLISCESAENQIKVTFSKNENASGINIYPLGLSVNCLHKVTFDVTSDVSVPAVDIWVKANSDKEASSGNSKFSFSANSPKTITMYVPAYQNKNEILRTLQVWISTKTACNLTISNFKSEVTNLADIKKEDSSLNLYFAGMINGKWSPQNIGSFTVNANTIGNGQVLLCDSSIWDSTNPITIFRVLSKDSTSSVNVQRKIVETEDRFYFENNTSNEITVNFELTENNEVLFK
mgnify:CR=1 FL=1